MAHRKRDDFTLSKKLAWLLRHGAVKEGIHIDTDGFMNVDDILNHRSFARAYSKDDIIRIVDTNDKKRFELFLNPDTKRLQIKAAQGHSLKCVDDSSLERILQDNITVIHGTYKDFWPSIKLSGLSRMGRNHIHFATNTPKHFRLVSGMRNNVEIYIYINLKIALADGIQFYRSSNGVILSPGNKDGILETKYFLKVLLAASEKQLEF